MSAHETATLQIDEAIAHLSKKTLASALEVSVKTLDRDLAELKNRIHDEDEDDPELSHRKGERGYPLNTAKYLILCRAMVKRGMSRNRAAESIADQCWRGIDFLIDKHLAQSVKPVYELINKLSGVSDD